MSYKTLLVSLNEVGRLAELVAAAVDLARETGAHVSGLYVIPAVQVYPSVGFEAAPQVFEGNRSFFKDNTQRVKQAFEEAMRREALPHDFHLLDARTPVIAEEVIAIGRSADLVMVSATNTDEITGVERDFVEQVVMAVGRPVIVLPAKGDARIWLKEIVIGWDGGREAARAAFDSLPLLKAAEKVRVLVLETEASAGGVADGVMIVTVAPDVTLKAPATPSDVWSAARKVEKVTASVDGGWLSDDVSVASALVVLSTWTPSRTDETVAAARRPRFGSSSTRPTSRR